jgi:zinc transporter
MDERPASIVATDLTQLHREVGALASLVENQLYSVAALNAADSESLRDPHRKAYIEDLVSELELAQRGINRLVGQVKDLDSAFQSASTSRVERRLRILTVISAVTLPLGLIAGLLGMNVGGVPGIADSNGFAIVVGLMAAIVVAELWYFRHAGWFD